MCPKSEIWQAGASAPDRLSDIELYPNYNQFFISQPASILLALLLAVSQMPAGRKKGAGSTLDIDRQIATNVP